MAPSQVVGWFGAMQAQNYQGALWAIGLRTAGADRAEVERALADRTIVRTWPMRGTLHIIPALVCPLDVVAADTARATRDGREAGATFA